MLAMTIGKAAALAGVSVATVRYYEEIGLLSAAPRTASNRRTFDETDVQRLAFIRHGRELGFRIDAIRQLLALAGLPDAPCEQADEIARTRLAEIESKIARLGALRRELRHMIEQGRHGSIRECRVIEVLADHDD